MMYLILSYKSMTWNWINQQEQQYTTIYQKSDLLRYTGFGLYWCIGDLSKILTLRMLPLAFSLITISIIYLSGGGGIGDM